MTKYEAEMENMMWTEKDKDAFHYMMESPNGRWFVARILDKTRINVPLNHQNIMYDEGRREVGLEVLAMIRSFGMEGMEKIHTMENEYAEFKLNLERMKSEWQKKT